MKDYLKKTMETERLTLDDIISSLQSMKMADIEHKEEIQQLQNTVKLMTKDFDKEKNKRKKLEGDRTSIHDALTKLEDELNIAQAQQALLSHENNILSAKLKDIYDCPICCEHKINRVLSCGHTFCADCALRFFQCERCPSCLQKPLGLQCLFFT